MGDLDPAPFQELFDAEPSDPAASDAPTWIRLYEELIAMMERQLEETRAFAMRAPEAMNQYLSRENIAILEEEIVAFKSRLAHWATARGSQQ
jgi:hypothetical protein